MAFSPDGKVLAVAENGGVAALWQVATRSLITPVLNATTAGATSAVAFSPRASELATVSRNGVARLWDLTNFRNITQAAAVGSPHALAFSRSGRTLAVVGTDRTVQAWDLSTSHRPGEPIPAKRCRGDAVTVSPDRFWPPAFSTGRPGCACAPAA